MGAAAMAKKRDRTKRSTPASPQVRPTLTIRLRGRVRDERRASGRVDALAAGRDESRWRDCAILSFQPVGGANAHRRRATRTARVRHTPSGVFAPPKAVPKLRSTHCRFGASR